ncbi:hypothetical protein [Haloplanus pelagicus]|jgi:hypothetical protein|uniref:hypothetical protein n=1 Tax=Haloplanus pelagicus TaxID=2949995 RepID=UPI00203D6EEE|nr:hypothetical protein [Haloplanus sp. HW8-1]
MVPITREGRIEWIRRNLIPLLDSQLSDHPDKELDEESINTSEKILAEEYLDEGSGIFKTFGKVTLPMIIIDSVSYMPPQVYGLVFSTLGTFIMLVEADILGSEPITAQSMDTVGGPTGGKEYLDEEKVRRLANNTVITNIGLVWLFFGFTMQIIAVWAISSETLIQPIWYINPLFWLS